MGWSVNAWTGTQSPKPSQEIFNPLLIFFIYYCPSEERGTASFTMALL